MIPKYTIIYLQQLDSICLKISTEKILKILISRAKGSEWYPKWNFLHLSKWRLSGSEVKLFENYENISWNSLTHLEHVAQVYSLRVSETLTAPHIGFQCRPHSVMKQYLTKT